MRKTQAEDWLKRVGLGGFGDRYPHQLSGGMRKRTSLAQTLALDPDIILMDEPFSALDIQTRQLMENEVLELWAAKKKAVLFITHDLDEAIAMSDRVIVLSAGPASHPIGEFAVDLARPRDVAESQDRAALHRAARGDLGRAARRSAEGLSTTTRGLRAAPQEHHMAMANTQVRAARAGRIRHLVPAVARLPGVLQGRHRRGREPTAPGQRFFDDAEPMHCDLAEVDGVVQRPGAQHRPPQLLDDGILVLPAGPVRRRRPRAAGTWGAR